MNALITVEQIRAARAMLGFKQHELAKKAGVSTGTLNNIERGVQTDPKISTLRAIRQALEDEGIEFTGQEMDGFGIRLRSSRKMNGAVTLLIIDDNDADRKLYRAWLGKQPDAQYTIIEAENAREGYEACVQHGPSCILLDFMMYGKNGFQLLVEMKKEHIRVPPILFITAIHNDVIKKNVLSLGVHAYLDKKNITREKLCEAVGKAVA
jgi:CheY-like chemotaxis protein/DNA-binding XRE family transcriptional regulator